MILKNRSLVTGVTKPPVQEVVIQLLGPTTIRRRNRSSGVSYRSPPVGTNLTTVLPRPCQRSGCVVFRLSQPASLLLIASHDDPKLTGAQRRTRLLRGSSLGA